jgi:hypothetical protein
LCHDDRPEQKRSAIVTAAHRSILLAEESRQGPDKPGHDEKVGRIIMI